MQLTKTYSRVAIFDTSVKLEEGSDKIGDEIELIYGIYDYYFIVDNFKYKVTFQRKDYEDFGAKLREKKTFGVEFAFLSVVGEGEEREIALNRLHPDVRKMYEGGRTYKNWEIMKIGNSYKILSSVISIIKQFISSRPDVEVLYFSAREPSRISLYEAVLKKLAPGNKVETYVNSYGAKAFEVYLKNDIN